MNQLDLDQAFLVSLMNGGLEAYRKLPLNFRSTVFTVASLQEIFKIIELLAKENLPIDPRSVAKHLDQKLSSELETILRDVPPSSYFPDGEIVEAAMELIRRTEDTDYSGDSQFIVTEDAKEPIDTSKFKPMGLSELIEILGLSIKKDEQNKVITFLCALSAYSEDSQINVSFNAPSSTGKSYIPTEIARLFPKEDVIQIGYCSPTAFFHDCGKFVKEKGGYVVDLERKIVIFLDQPHTQLLQHLRPLLSHDEKEIGIKITDKSQKFGLKTKNVFLRGFPAVIFCTAGMKIDEQESTRFLLLSPEMDQEKIQLAVEQKIEKETDNRAFNQWLESDPRRTMLKERNVAIKRAGIREIKIGSPGIVRTEFFRQNKILKPRHQRDIGRITGLIKALALLNLWFRECDGHAIVANDDDIGMAFAIWETIAESQDLNLPPFIYQVYKDVILPAYRTKNTNSGDLQNDIRSGLLRKDITHTYFQIHGRPLPDFLLRQQILPMLEAAGLINQEADQNDKRKILVFPTVLLEGNSELEGGVNNSERSGGVHEQPRPTIQLTISSNDGNEI